MKLILQFYLESMINQVNSSNFKPKVVFGLFLILSLFGFIFIHQIKAQELPKESQSISTEELETGTSPSMSKGTRVVISTSGSAKFKSYWLSNPPRLVVEFQSRNILSKIDNEVILNQGVIKKISSSYFGRGRDKSLRSLTFELMKKVPYKIWQEGNTILLDIQVPLKTAGFSIGTKGKEVFIKSEATSITKRLEKMDIVLKQVAEAQPSLGGLVTPVTNKTQEAGGKGKPESKVILPELLKTGQPMIILVWLGGLVSISGLGFLVWRRYHRNNVNNSRNIAERIKELKLHLQEKDKRLEQEEAVRKMIEKTALEKEKEYARLQQELREKDKLLKQEETTREELGKVVQEKDKEYEQLKDSFESLKDTMVRKGLVKEAISKEGKEGVWIPEESPEKRQYPRLTLTQDYNRTIILRINSPNQPESIKSFANDISPEGLCFGTKKEFQEKEPLNLILFFYGDKVPIMKIPGQIVWKRSIGSTNYYGVCFKWLREEDKSELNYYIESKIKRG